MEGELMKKKILSTVMMFTLLLTTMLSVSVSNTDSVAKNHWGCSDTEDYPISISCDPSWPLIGPEVGETREEVVQGLRGDEGNRITSIKVKNYSPKIVKIKKVKKNKEYGAQIWIKGLKKGKAHIKVTVKLKYAQSGKKTYVWNIKKYPVGYND